MKKGLELRFSDYSWIIHLVVWTAVSISILTGIKYLSEPTQIMTIHSSCEDQ